MVHLPIDTTVVMSPRLINAVRTTNNFSPAERLFLAKALLDSLVATTAEKVAATPMEPDEHLPTLADVVAQIKATPPNPDQIQRATKTVDEVLASWVESPAEEPGLTTEEWEENWWTIRQTMKQRDERPDLLTDQVGDDHG